MAGKTGYERLVEASSERRHREDTFDTRIKTFKMGFYVLIAMLVASNAFWLRMFTKGSPEQNYAVADSYRE